MCALCTKEYNPKCAVVVNGRQTVGLRDTGAGQIVVAKDLVPDRAYTGRTTNVVLAESHCRYEVPIVEITLESPFINGQIEAVVLENPVEKILIGNYAKRVDTGKWERVPVYAALEKVSAVQTRAQARERHQQQPLKVQGI
ncbi:hypothetical protein ACOMHN_033819 [Nucella lapillus]